MKVMCVDAELTKNTLTEGEIYVVEREGSLFGEPIYYLQGLEGPYLRNRFVPISDIDETLLVSEEFNEKYLVPVK
jgi:hypothetical protein